MLVKLRSLVLLVPLLVSTGASATADEPLGPEEVALPVVELVSVPPVITDGAGPMPVVAAEEPADPEPSWDRVHWTVAQDESVESVAGRWGMKTRELRRLNPDLRGLPRVHAGVSLLVYERDEERPTRSIGAPNSGRLQSGMPLPEGRYWQLRERRTRTFGAENSIRAMVTAFNAYGEAFEDAPPVLVGEISSRRGGRADPHRSHRTGRDVDLGYILKPREGATEEERRKWKRANPDNFDVERNWALIQALVETGEVQQIFVSVRLQRLLKPVAREQLSPEDFARYFRVPGADRERMPILKHWDGHRDHMHVRFRCEDGNARCRSRSTRPHKHRASA
ncbi:MAG: penicillin-insensitive murein endopeptidase [Deltaproteobacteria bacterium]|nr:penicillin-insensitive murein endopeptidase [Deltaproteobacteria bacterium]